MSIFRNIDLGRLNSATAYPSIPTYHTLGEKGRLLEPAVDFGGRDVVATEKVDGTNARIIVPPAGYATNETFPLMIGSRGEMLYHEGDLLHVPTMGIVDTLLPHLGLFPATARWRVYYVEVYGDKVGAQGKNYTKEKGRTGFRLFDILEMDQTSFENILTKDVAAIASWRDAGGQSFCEEGRLQNIAFDNDIPLVPRFAVEDVLPRTIVGMQEYLLDCATKTQVALDDTGLNDAEGLVFRTRDRQTIAKARFEDYARTLRVREKATC